MSEEPRSSHKREHQIKTRLNGKASSLSDAAPTLNETLRPISPPGQSPDGAVNPSSTKQASP